MYESIKYAHMLFVTISIVLFEYRFLLKVLHKPAARLLKIIPHINDTLLLIAGISLAFMGGINPLHQTWLAAKIIALLFYIAFGMIALKSTGMKSMLAYVLATATFLFMLFTAITKTPFFINL